MELPQRYGHYLLLERVAVGGMGEVFRASYAGLAGFERACAIKRILPHLSDDEEFTDRLISEAKIAVQLAHNNIVQVYELGKIENEYFIAMEWVDGPDLSTLSVKAKAKDIPMPLPLGIWVVHEIARAVDYAHRKTDAEGRPLGIVHRDISPQNVMISMDGAVKLTDFGIARAGGIARKFATGMGAVLGKRRYMSPEQRRGEAVDARSDIYSLGALLYECVAGHAPEPEGPPAPLSSLAQNVPPELDAIALSALQQDPAKRTGSAAAVVEELDRVFVKMAFTDGGVRDAALELGRYVRKVAPPGEKGVQKRSLTDRMRAAMGRAGANGSEVAEPTGAGEGLESTGTVDVRVDGPQSVTLVLSQVLSPRGAPAQLLPEDATGPTPSLGRDGGPLGVVETADVEVPDRDRPTAPAAARAEPTTLDETGTGVGAALLSTPLPSEPDRAATKLRRRPPAPRPVLPETMIGPAPGAPEEPLMPDARRDGTARRLALPVAGLAVALGLIAAIARFAVHGNGPVIAIDTPAPLATRTAAIVPATPRPTPPVVATAPPTPRPTAVVVATPPPTPRPTPTPRATATSRPKATPTKVAVATPIPTVKVEAFGTLEIGANPWGYVTVDGVKMGNTPLKDLKLKAGPHTVTVDNPKLGMTKTQTVVVPPDGVGRWVVNFRTGAAGSP